jgi:hypothetical protein
LSAFPALEFGDVRPERFGEIRDFGHGSDCGTGRFDGISLFDGDCGRNSFNAVGLRFVHPVQKLPGVRRKSLDVPTLTFGKKSFKSE